MISLAKAYELGAKVSPPNLAALNRLIAHTAEDMTAIVQAGMILSDLQNALRQHGQWLPIDPPAPERLTVGELLEANVSGPRRFGYGTIRDYVIGMTVILADGRMVHSGGKVVKNVAGYDLMKLFIGSYGSLGVIIEAIFKVLPCPESEGFIGARCASLEQADELIKAILDSDLRPVILDLHRLAAAVGHFSLVLGFTGTQEDVAWQLSKAAEFGVSEATSLGYQNAFFMEAAPVAKKSVLPSKLFESIRGLGEVPFVARAGNGTIYHRGPSGPTVPGASLHLDQRLKSIFDPKHILPDYPK